MRKVTSSPEQKRKSSFLFALGGFLIAYLILHLFNLEAFPVFADEAIYIRWAQLLLDDWKQYLFFALNDGKTPLFVWFIALTQWATSNQLIAARLVSVLGGLTQAVAVALILKELGAKRFTQMLGVILVTTLPYWFMYHRLAVMDGWLTAWLSLSFWASLKVNQTRNRKWRWIVITGLFYGAALWTKLPALFYLPIFVILPFFSTKRDQKYDLVNLFQLCLPQLLAAGVGLCVFLALRISPAFGQLFARGQDFSFTLSEVVAGKWTESFPNVLRFIGYFASYLTYPVLLAAVAGLFSERERKRVALLLLCSLIFLSPFILLGKVVHPRYLLPAALFLTLAASLSLESLCLRCSLAVQQGKVLWVGVAFVIALLLGQVFTQSAVFISHFLFSPDTTPLVAVDRTQYLEEWSSGHGITETVQLIQQLTADHTVAVATEGRFGTLPDALLLYFHGKNVENLYIEGTGQYPVKSLPDFFTERAKDFDQSLLVVNSHRMELKLPPQALIAEYCRPNAAPCLQVWDVTALVKAVPSSQIP